MVDDNYHYMDPDERWEKGVYETLDETLAVCRGLVDRFLEESYKPGMSAEALYADYTGFGEDPFIVVLDGEDPRAKFSAWDYAQERCSAICGKQAK
jgi:hypothetical protein